MAITAGIAMSARRPNGFAKVKESVVVIGYLLMDSGVFVALGS